jgi:hypothetical protein
MAIHSECTMLEKVMDQLREAPRRLQTDGARWVGAARNRARVARGRGEEQAFTRGTAALERLEGWLSERRDIPGLARVVPRAEELVHEGLVRVTALPIADYDTLSAKDVGRALRDLPRVDLLRVRRHEQAGKGRKTVLDAVERELARRMEGPEAPTDAV